MIEYRIIQPKEKDKIVELIKAVTNGLERKDFFIPFPDEAINEMLDNKRAIIYGAYDAGELVGTSQLYLGDEFVEEIAKKAGIFGKRVAEFGGSLVLTEYRGKGIMKTFMKILVEEAKRLQFQYVVAVTHPENYPAQKAILSEGAHFICSTILEGYERNIYAVKLE